MLKYARVINESTGLCEVGLGPDSQFYKSIGMKELNVELGYDGAYYLFGWAPKKPLEQAKTEQKAKLNSARDRAEQGGFEYLGKVFDSDPISCQRISCAAQALQVVPAASDGTEPTITWTTQDNSMIELNAAELVGLVVALAAWSNSCHERATKLKAKVDQAYSVELVESITWDSDPDEPLPEPVPEPEPEVDPDLSADINAILGAE